VTVLPAGAVHHWHFALFDVAQSALRELALDSGESTVLNKTNL